MFLSSVLSPFIFPFVSLILPCFLIRVSKSGAHYADVQINGPSIDRRISRQSCFFKATRRYFKLVSEKRHFVYMPYLNTLTKLISLPDVIYSPLKNLTSCITVNFPGFRSRPLLSKAVDRFVYLYSLCPYHAAKR